VSLGGVGVAGLKMSSRFCESCGRWVGCVKCVGSGSSGVVRNALHTSQGAPLRAGVVLRCFCGISRSTEVGTHMLGQVSL
jgi:hypothetical protein